MKWGKKCEIFPVRYHLSVVFKTKVAAGCVISNCYSCREDSGNACCCRYRSGSAGCWEAWGVGVLCFSTVLNSPRDVCPPPSHALARSVDYPKGDLPAALVSGDRTPVLCCAFSFPFLNSLKTQLPCPAASCSFVLWWGAISVQYLCEDDCAPGCHAAKCEVLRQ